MSGLVDLLTLSKLRGYVAALIRSCGPEGHGSCSISLLQKLQYQTLKDVRLKDQDGHLALASLSFSSGGRLPLCSGTINF